MGPNDYYLKKCQNVFQCDCLILLSHQQRTRIPGPLLLFTTLKYIFLIKKLYCDCNLSVETRHGFFGLLCSLGNGCDQSLCYIMYRWSLTYNDSYNFFDFMIKQYTFSRNYTLNFDLLLG